MKRLIPRDHWEHRLTDHIQAISVALAAPSKVRKLILPDFGECLTVRSGRAALLCCLKALGLEPGARVGVPLFCCPVVFRAIKESGCVVRFIDVDPDTYCISVDDLKRKMSQIDAIVPVHMFGNPCDMEELLRVTQGRPIIEDCAQSLGSKIRGIPVGSFGTMSFFSFRSGKYLSAGEGGAIYTKNTALRDKAAKIISMWPASNRPGEMIHTVKVYVRSVLRSKPLYGLIGHALWRVANSKLELSENPTIQIGKIFASDYEVITRRLRRLASIIGRQRIITDSLLKDLEVDRKMVLVESSDGFSNRYLFPLKLASREHRDSLAAYLLDSRIDTMIYLNNIVSVATKDYGYVGDCPVSEDLSQRVIILPNYYDLRDTDIKHIVSRTNEWMKSRKSYRLITTKDGL